MTTHRAVERRAAPSSATGTAWPVPQLLVLDDDGGASGRPRPGGRSTCVAAVADDDDQVARARGLRAAATAWPTRRPAADGCSTFGVADFIRVPSPAARTTTAAGRSGLTRGALLGEAADGTSCGPRIPAVARIPAVGRQARRTAGTTDELPGRNRTCDLHSSKGWPLTANTATRDAATQARRYGSAGRVRAFRIRCSSRRS